MYGLLAAMGSEGIGRGRYCRGKRRDEREAGGMALRATTVPVWF